MAPDRYRGQQQKTALDRVMTRFAYSRLGRLLFITIIPAIDRPLLALTGGRLKLALGQTVLLLHARGARSGLARATPLLYTPRGDEYIPVASKAGAAHHPAWYHNLRAHPEVEFELGGRRAAVTAREAEGQEREELWRLVNDNYRGYDVYQHRAGARRIPVMVLSPR